MIVIGYAVEMFNVWSLCSALWGELPTVSETASQYVIRQARREAVSNWLTEVTKDKIFCEVKSHLDKVCGILVSYHFVCEICYYDECLTLPLSFPTLMSVSCTQ